MDGTAPLAYESLPLERREAVERLAQKLRKDYELPGELLTIEDLARVMGLNSKTLWNYRTRGNMPAIPSRKVGAHDMYWVGHVAMWLIDPGSVAVKFNADLPKDAPSAVDVRPTSRNAKGKGSSGSKDRAQTMNVAKAALMARANAEFERRLVETKKG